MYHTLTRNISDHLDDRRADHRLSSPRCHVDVGSSMFAVINESKPIIYMRHP
jgi:hypothetical protein